MDCALRRTIGHYVMKCSRISARTRNDNARHSASEKIVPTLSVCRAALKQTSAGTVVMVTPVVVLALARSGLTGMYRV